MLSNQYIYLFLLSFYKSLQRSDIMFNNRLFPDSFIYLPSDIRGHDWHKTSCFLDTKQKPSCMKKRPQDMNCTLKVPLEDLNLFIKKRLED